MNEHENKETTLPSDGTETATQSSSDATNETGSPTRRELITRYGKYAIATAPFLLFVSKARAIKSAP